MGAELTGVRVFLLVSKGNRSSGALALLEKQRDLGAKCHLVMITSI